MNLTKMIIMMFLHCVSDLAWFYQLSTKDLLEKVLSDPLQKSIYQRHCQNLETIYAKFDRAVSRVAFPFLLCLSLSRCASRGLGMSKNNVGLKNYSETVYLRPRIAQRGVFCRSRASFPNLLPQRGLDDI